MKTNETVKEPCKAIEPPMEEQLHEVLPSHFRLEWKQSREHSMILAAAKVIEVHGLEAEWLKEYLEITSKANK